MYPVAADGDMAWMDGWKKRRILFFNLILAFGRRLERVGSGS